MSIKDMELVAVVSTEDEAVDVIAEIIKEEMRRTMSTQNETNHEINQDRVKDVINSIEEACKGKDKSLYIPSYYNTTEEEARCAFSAFENRRDELAKIQSLNINIDLLPAAAPLFETDTIKDLTISGNANAFQWPSSMEKCHNLTSLEMWHCDELAELPSWIRHADSLQCLKIYESGITSIPDWIGDLRSLTELSLENNKSLKTLSENIGNLQSLTKLLLENNDSLKALPDSIGNLKNLTILKIDSYNQNLVLEQLPDSIGNLQSLKELSLKNNDSLKFLPDSIGNLKNLTILKLESSYYHTSVLEKLPDSIGNLQSLKELSLRNNNSLKNLPDSIGNLQSLSKLSLQNNDSLEVLPNSIGNLQSLTVLYLSNNRSLKTLPDSIGNLKSLTGLSLRNNDSLKVLPDSIGDLQSLIGLSLTDNKNLKTLPDSIGNLKKLTNLNIEGSYNRSSALEQLPDSIGNLQSLSKLSLTDNKILKALPDTIGNLQSLTELSLQGIENLKVLPDSIGSLKKLAILNITSTYYHDSTIEQLSDSIGNLQSLTKLLLDENKNLKALPDTIGNLQSLTELSLKNCKSLKILPDSIGNLKNLTTLDIRDCPVKQLPASIVNLSALEYVNICRTKIDTVPKSISSVKTFIERMPIEIIPQNYSPSYRGFVNCYYRLVKTIVRFSEKARREGLLALEDELDYLGDDLLKQGLRLVVDGTDAGLIRDIMELYIERENDYYKKKLMQIAEEGVLSVQSGDNTRILIMKLGSWVKIKNNPIDAAWEKYLAGDNDAFFNIDYDAAIQPEEEREESRFIKRAVELNAKARREGLLSLEKDLDNEAIANRDIFEYGLSLIGGCERKLINDILTRLISRETDPVRKNIDMAKKEAVMSIFNQVNTRILALKLFAYFDKSIAKALEREILKD